MRPFQFVLFTPLCSLLFALLLAYSRRRSLPSPAPGPGSVVEGDPNDLVPHHAHVCAASVSLLLLENQRSQIRRPVATSHLLEPRLVRRIVISSTRAQAAAVAAIGPVHVRQASSWCWRQLESRVVWVLHQEVKTRRGCQCLYSSSFWFYFYLYLFEIECELVLRCFYLHQ